MTSQELKKYMEENYSKRELDEHFKDVKSSIGGVKEVVDELNIKVGIQNGRVGKTEATLKGSLMAGSVAVFLLSIIMSLVVYSFNISQSNLRANILLEVKGIK